MTIPVHPLGNRNAAATVPGLDQDNGPGTVKTVKAHTPTQDEISAAVALRFQHMMQMLTDQGFNYSHPVDEYMPQGLSTSSASFPNQLTIQPDYDMPERIETVSYIIPVGATLATIQLGQRVLVVYSGAALATPLVNTMRVQGLILNSDDQRILTITGALTSAPYIGLTGWALTRGQFS